jgi:hypothetical protein
MLPLQEEPFRTSIHHLNEEAFSMYSYLLNVYLQVLYISAGEMMESNVESISVCFSALCPSSLLDLLRA